VYFSNPSRTITSGIKLGVDIVGGCGLEMARDEHIHGISNKGIHSLVFSFVLPFELLSRASVLLRHANLKPSNQT